MIELNTKTDIYRLMPKNAKVAEVGVRYGTNAKDMYDIASPEMLYLVDAWKTLDITYKDIAGESQELHDNNLARTKALFESRPNHKIVRELSLDAVESLPTLSWVYIDADHSYEGCLADLKAYDTITTDYICGHDWLLDSNINPEFGVNKAVQEFVWDNGYYLSALTVNQPGGYNSYVISKTKEANDRLVELRSQ